MTVDEQVPRNALVWIIATQFVVLLPHVGRLPLWVPAIYLAAALWRVMVYKGRWSFPGSWLKSLLAVLCFGGIALEYRSIMDLEPTVALLLIAYALKLIELSDRRDAYIVVFIAYFTCLTEFLFTQELLFTAYTVFATWMNTTALVALHQPGQARFNGRSALRSGSMLAQAVPLMLIMFFVFPRIGPLWNIPLKKHAARTGVSDNMRPGDIASLGLNDDVAFRASFKGEVPPRSQLYWRGLVFSTLENGAWRSLRWRDVPAGERRASEPTLVGDPVEYSIIMEPTQQNWLYALRYATTDDAGIMSLNDFRLLSPMEVQDQKRYSVRSWPDAVLERTLSDWRRTVEKTLPEDANPRTRALAAKLFREAGQDPERFVYEIMRMFRSQEYFYTLRPPLLENDRMDQFLFETRRGFCEHYAAAFVWMMRAAGVPARVVVGYQGGEINPVNGTVIVHQFDAHAWSEVWLQGQGWVRFDPTAAIAPDRVEFGLEQALAAEGTFLADNPLSPLRFRQISWLNSLRLQLDAINYSWQVFVLGYDRESQFDLFNRLFGNATRSQLVIGIMLAWALLLAPVGAYVLWRSRGPRLRTEDRIYLKYCKILEALGVVRESGEPPRRFAQRAMDALPALADEIGAVTSTYERVAFERDGDPDAMLELRRRVGQFKRR